MKKLPDGEYPFRDCYYPLGEMVMNEAPPALEALLQSQAASQGIAIARNEPVELVCELPEMAPQRFLVYWPSGDAGMHLLVPRHLAKGLA